jgi:ribosomal 50S subunit-associated protein YjgA (DUF615 family)
MAVTNDELAKLCLDHAWRDEIDDDSRWLLEMAAKRIERTSRRCLRLAQKLEVAQAKLEHTREEGISWQLRLQHALSRWTDTLCGRHSPSPAEWFRLVRRSQSSET